MNFKETGIDLDSPTLSDIHVYIYSDDGVADRKDRKV